MNGKITDTENSLKRGGVAESLNLLENALMELEFFWCGKEKTLNYDAIHSMKSFLYAIIEKLGRQGEKIFLIQRMLREIFIILNTQYDSSNYDREVGLQLIEEIKKRVQKL